MGLVKNLTEIYQNMYVYSKKLILKCWTIIYILYFHFLTFEFEYGYGLLKST